MFKDISLIDWKSIVGCKRILLYEEVVDVRNILYEYIWLF